MDFTMFILQSNLRREDKILALQEFFSESPCPEVLVGFYELATNDGSQYNTTNMTDKRPSLPRKTSAGRTGQVNSTPQIDAPKSHNNNAGTASPSQLALISKLEAELNITSGNIDNMSSYNANILIKNLINQKKELKNA